MILKVFPNLNDSMHVTACKVVNLSLKELLYLCYVNLPSLLSYQMDLLPKSDVQYWESPNVFLYNFEFTFSTCYNLSGACIMNKMD